MKKFYAFALCSVLAFNISCKKEETAPEEPVEIDGSLSVEEGKNELEKNSINLLEKIEAFKDDKALNEMIELAEFLNNPTSNNSTFQKTVFNTLSNISSIKNEDIIIFNAKQSVTIINEDSLLEDFNNEKGIYNWNDDSKEFEKSGNSDDIIFNIEYDNGKKAVFSFTDFNTGISNEEEVPTLVKANLKIGSTVVFSQDFSATLINKQILPASIKNTTSIGGFSFTTSYTNSNNDSVEQTTAFTLNNETIMSFTATVKGNLNNSDAEGAEDILDNANMTFTFLDAAITMDLKDSNVDSNKDYSIQEAIALLNSNTNAELIVNNKSVAKSEFYKDTDTYTNYEINPNTGNLEKVEVSEDIINVRFVFEDETTSDFDTYIDGSFTELESKFDAVFNAYESLFEDFED